jgi:hypothetical protein
VSEYDREGGGPGPLGAVAPWGRETGRGEYEFFAKLPCGWQYLKSYAHLFFLERLYPSCYMSVCVCVCAVQSFESFCTRA